MRNLVCLGKQGISIPSVHNANIPLTAIAHDPSSENVIFVARKVDQEFEILKSNGSAFAPFESWTSSTSSQEAIIDFRYLSGDTSLCCILSGGDIVIIRLERSENERVEIIGNIEGGILAALWSPDEQILAIVSGLSKLIYMTPDFDTITEITLSSSDVTQHINQVSVGWGRAETQFRGLRAKNAPRDPTLPVNVDQGVLSPQDNRGVGLHWRGDGECLALSRIEEERGKTAKRVVRMYTRDGQVESFSEPIDGLEGVVSWRPSGQWIATVRRNGENEAEIVFLERNGLQHGGFPLRNPGPQIRRLAWNCDSSVLAVSLGNRVQLWMMSNYEWRLKQEIKIRPEDMSTYDIEWHSEKPLILYIYSGVVVERYEYMLDLCKDSSNPPFDYGLIAIIDGEILKLTPLRISNVPPPMAASELSLSSPAVHVSFDSTGQCFAILSQDDVAIATWETFKPTRINNPKILNTIILGKFFLGHYFARQIVLLEQNLVAILADDNESSSVIKILRKQQDGDQFEELYCIKGVGMIVRLFTQVIGGHLLFETNDGKVHDLGEVRSQVL